MPVTIVSPGGFSDVQGRSALVLKSVHSGGGDRCYKKMMSAVEGMKRAGGDSDYGRGGVLGR